MHLFSQQSNSTVPPFPRNTDPVALHFLTPIFSVQYII